MSTIKRVTPNYNLRIPVFDAPGWGRELERSYAIIDAVMFAISGFTNVKGVWNNNIIYEVGQRVVDANTSLIYAAQVGHTSAVTGTFDEDRLAHPTYWKPVTSTASNKGQWTTATSYSTNDFVFDQSRVGIVLAAYVSGASYDADVTNGNIATIVDLSTQLTDAENAVTNASASAAASNASAADSLAQAVIANNHRIAAQAAQTAAELAEVNAEAAETNAVAARDTAVAAAANADADAAATAADRVQTGLDAVATAADRVQTGIDAAAAAASAAEAATFDPNDYYIKATVDAFLGAKFDKTGGTLTGNLTISPSSGTQLLVLNGPDVSQRAQISFQQGGATKHLLLTEVTSSTFSHWVQGAAASAYIINPTTAAMMFPKRATFSEGLATTGGYAASPTDLSKQLAIYSTSYGLSVTAGKLNVVTATGGGFDFYSGATLVSSISSTGALSGPAWNTWGGSTDATTAIDNKIAAVAVPSAALAKAWVRFNGTGTVATLSSYGVTSITDNGTGNYTVNLAVALPDTNFAVLITAIGGATNTIPGGASSGAATTPLTRTTTSVSFETRRASTGAAEDHADINVVIFR